MSHKIKMNCAYLIGQTFWQWSSQKNKWVKLKYSLMRRIEKDMLIYKCQL